MPKPSPLSPATFEWRALPPLQFPRANPVVVALEDGRVLAVGRTGWLWDQQRGWVRHDDLVPEVLDASRSSWRPAPDLVGADGLLGAVRALSWDAGEQCWVASNRLPDRPAVGDLALPDGTEVVVGGKRYEKNETFPTALDLVLIRPPRGPARSCRLRCPRIRAALTPLPDGRVLVTGGYRVDVYFYDHDKDVPAEEAEIIDPARATVRSAGRLVKPRDEHGVAVLPDGSIILVGGRDHLRASLADAEMGCPVATCKRPARRKPAIAPRGGR